MATMDMTAHGADTDYSDFQYQTAQFALGGTPQGPDNNVSVSGVTSIPPLAGVGGLDNNEVAELVAIEVIAYLEIEDEFNDQTTHTQVQGRGVVGANLSTTQDAFVQAGNKYEGDTFDVSGDLGGPNADALTMTDDRKFQIFVMSADAGADDGTSGGAGGSTDNFHATKNFRELVGRGPVLDSSDDVTCAIDVNTGDLVNLFTGLVHVHMIWDVAETDDAGRAFSVPN